MRAGIGYVLHTTSSFNKVFSSMFNFFLTLRLNLKRAIVIKQSTQVSRQNRINFQCAKKPCVLWVITYMFILKSNVRMGVERRHVK